MQTGVRLRHQAARMRPLALSALVATVIGVLAVCILAVHPATSVTTTEPSDAPAISMTANMGSTLTDHVACPHCAEQDATSAGVLALCGLVFLIAWGLMVIAPTTGFSEYAQRLRTRPTRRHSTQRRPMLSLVQLSISRT